jgi:hypothetical protein
MARKTAIPKPDTIETTYSDTLQFIRQQQVSFSQSLHSALTRLFYQIGQAIHQCMTNHPPAKSVSFSAQLSALLQPVYGSLFSIRQVDQMRLFSQRVSDLNAAALIGAYLPWQQLIPLLSIADNNIFEQQLLQLTGQSSRKRRISGNPTHQWTTTVLLRIFGRLSHSTSPIAQPDAFCRESLAALLLTPDAPLTATDIAVRKCWQRISRLLSTFQLEQATTLTAMLNMCLWQIGQHLAKVSKRIVKEATPAEYCHTLAIQMQDKFFTPDLLQDLLTMALIYPDTQPFFLLAGLAPWSVLQVILRHTAPEQHFFYALLAVTQDLDTAALQKAIAHSWHEQTIYAALVRRAKRYARLNPKKEVVTSRRPGKQEMITQFTYTAPTIKRPATHSLLNDHTAWFAFLNA